METAAFLLKTAAYAYISQIDKPLIGLALYGPWSIRCILNYIVLLYTNIHYNFSEASSSGLHSSHHYVFKLMRRVHHVNICNRSAGDRHAAATAWDWRTSVPLSFHSAALPPCINKKDLAGPEEQWL